MLLVSYETLDYDCIFSKLIYNNPFLFCHCDIHMRKLMQVGSKLNDLTNKKLNNEKN